MTVLPSLPLGGYRTVCSQDLDDARDQVARLYCPHRLSFASSSRSLALRHHHAKLAATSINYMDYGGDFLIEPGYLDRFFLFMAPIAGRVRVNAGAGAEITAAPGAAVLVNPTEHSSFRWSADCRQIVLTVDRAAIERCLATLVQRNLRAPIVFQGGIDHSTGRGASLWRAIQFVIQEFDAQGSGLIEPAAAAHFENTLAAMFLNGCESNYSAALRSVGNRIAPRQVRRVEAYIEANAHLPITLEMLVEAAGVSATALFEGFRRFRQTTPMAALRDHRMARAHDDLENPSDGDSVTIIATRWGFCQLGRFAADYKKRFGLSPSQALRQSRAR